MFIANRRWVLDPVLASLVILVASLSACKGPVSVNPDVTPPSEVRNLAVQSGSGSLLVTWDDPNEPDIDYIEIQLVPSGGQSAMVMPGIGTAILANLANGTEYSFRVQAVDNSGNRSYGLTRSGTPGVADETDTTAPGEVSGLLAISGNRQIALSWTAPADIDCDKVVITHNQSGGDTAIELPKNRFSVVYAGLENDITYTFTICAEDLAGNRSTGATVSASPQAPDDGIAPGPVTDLAATPGDGQVSLTWTLPDDADLNYLEISGLDDGLSFTIPGNSQTLTLGGLVNGESYTITVRTVDLGGLKSEGRNITFTLPTPDPGDTTPPDPVTELVAQAGPGQASLSWSEPSEDVGTIQLMIQAGAEGPESIFSLPPGRNGVVLAGLQPGTEYTFTLTVLDAAGNSSTTASVKVTPLEESDITSPGPVEGLTASPGNASVQLTWTDPAGTADEDLDHIQVRNDTSGATVTVAAAAQGILIGGLENNPPYPFTVRALDHSGNASSPRSITATPFLDSDTTPPSAPTITTLIL